MISIIPSIIGFSLGGYAIWLALGDSKFRDVISGESGDGEVSPYMSVNSAFVHFIIMQFLSLITALLFKSYLDSDAPLSQVEKLISGFGYGLFIYSLLCAVAATFSVLRVASWYDMYQTKRRKTESDNSSDKTG